MISVLSQHSSVTTTASTASTNIRCRFSNLPSFFLSPFLAVPSTHFDAPSVLAAFRPALHGQNAGEKFFRSQKVCMTARTLTVRHSFFSPSQLESSSILRSIWISFVRDPPSILHTAEGESQSNPNHGVSSRSRLALEAA